jgi:hypothetical protein
LPKRVLAEVGACRSGCLPKRVLAEAGACRRRRRRPWCGTKCRGAGETQCRHVPRWPPQLGSLAFLLRSGAPSRPSLRRHRRYFHGQSRSKFVAKNRGYGCEPQILLKQEITHGIVVSVFDGEGELDKIRFCRQSNFRTADARNDRARNAAGCQDCLERYPGRRAPPHMSTGEAVGIGLRRDGGICRSRGFYLVEHFAGMVDAAKTINEGNQTVTLTPVTNAWGTVIFAGYVLLTAGAIGIAYGAGSFIRPESRHLSAIACNLRAKRRLRFRAAAANAENSTVTSVKLRLMIAASIIWFIAGIVVSIILA